jgi:hypothetical protein
MNDTAPKKKFWTFRRSMIAFLVILVPALGFALYTAFTLSWSYSEGERSGILQKISLKGWVCKTYEGELAVTTQPGIAPVIWTFSVRDQKVAEQLNAALGKSVVLAYEEHPGVPTACFGETPYFVSRVQVAEIQR